MPTAVDSWMKGNKIQSRRQSLNKRNILATPISGLWASPSNALLKSHNPRTKSSKNIASKNTKLHMRSSSSFINPLIQYKNFPKREESK